MPHFSWTGGDGSFLFGIIVGIWPLSCYDEIFGEHQSNVSDHCCWDSSTSAFESLSSTRSRISPLVIRMTRYPADRGYFINHQNSTLLMEYEISPAWSAADPHSDTSSTSSSFVSLLGSIHLWPSSSYIYPPDMNFPYHVPWSLAPSDTHDPSALSIEVLSTVSVFISLSCVALIACLLCKECRTVKRAHIGDGRISSFDWFQRCTH